MLLTDSVCCSRTAFQIGLHLYQRARRVQDRQIDVYFASAPFPSAELQQLSALGKFRVLGVPEDKMETDGIKAALGVPGRKLTTLEPGSYSGLVNEEPVQLVNSVVGLGTN